MIDALHPTELKLFVDPSGAISGHTKQEPQITSAFLATGDIDGYDFNGIVTFSGAYNGHVIVSMPPQLLRELLAAARRDRPVRRQPAGRRGRDRQHPGRECPQALGSGLQISVP
jgi:chemotaxis protein CheX